MLLEVRRFGTPIYGPTAETCGHEDITCYCRTRETAQSMENGFLILVDGGPISAVAKTKHVIPFR
jgi:hypothetical protein